MTLGHIQGRQYEPQAISVLDFELARIVSLEQ
jgi:hypothetical protein